MSFPINSPYSSLRGDLTHVVRGSLDECQIFPGSGTSDLVDGATSLATDAVVANLVDFFLRHRRHTSQSGRSAAEVMHRYRLNWDRVFFMKGAVHGFKRAKRARSIKKRRSKRLVQKTKYRF